MYFLHCIHWSYKNGSLAAGSNTNFWAYCLVFSLFHISTYTHMWNHCPASCQKMFPDIEDLSLCGKIKCSCALWLIFLVEELLFHCSHIQKIIMKYKHQPFKWIVYLLKYIFKISLLYKKCKILEGGVFAVGETTAPSNTTTLTHSHITFTPWMQVSSLHTVGGYQEFPFRLEVFNGHLLASTMTQVVINSQWLLWKRRPTEFSSEGVGLMINQWSIL